MLDVVTILVILIVVGVNVAFLLWLAACPGKVARERGHPQADAIGVCGWLSLLTCFATWPVAMVWAYTKPVNISVEEAKGGKTP
jgi:hypothetical protein